MHFVVVYGRKTIHFQSLVPLLCYGILSLGMLYLRFHYKYMFEFPTPYVKLHNLWYLKALDEEEEEPSSSIYGSECVTYDIIQYLSS